MTRCAAPISQKTWRDLQLLPHFVDTVEWLENDALAHYEAPVVICGLWVADEPQKAKILLQQRSSSGRSTLIVPRYRGGDLAPVIGAPSVVNVRPGDSSEVEWEQDHCFAVSSVSYLQTSLRSGRWGRSKQGLVIFCFRPSTAAGAIVVCTAAIVSRSIGVSRTEQADLFTRTLAELDALDVSRPTVIREVGSESKAKNLEAFLDEEGPEGAALLLAMTVGEKWPKGLAITVQNLLGLKLPAGRLEHLQNRMPEAKPEDISAVLRHRGWSAYLRRVAQLAAGDQT
ncbi:MAG: hypothetical protein AB2605_02600 [Candidatus Thiodiazotropha sp.]